MKQNKIESDTRKELNRLKRKLSYTARLMGDFCTYIVAHMPREAYEENKKYIKKTYKNLLYRLEDSENAINEIIENL